MWYRETLLNAFLRSTFRITKSTWGSMCSLGSLKGPCVDDVDVVDVEVDDDDKVEVEVDDDDDVGEVGVEVEDEDCVEDEDVVGDGDEEEDEDAKT